MTTNETAPEVTPSYTPAAVAPAAPPPATHMHALSAGGVAALVAGILVIALGSFAFGWGAHAAVQRFGIARRGLVAERQFGFGGPGMMGHGGIAGCPGIQRGERGFGRGPRGYGDLPDQPQRGWDQWDGSTPTTPTP